MPATGDPVRLDGAPSDLADGVLEALYGLKGRRRGRGMNGFRSVWSRPIGRIIRVRCARRPYGRC